MRSVKSPVKGWKTVGTRLAILIVIVLQTLGLGAGTACVQVTCESKSDWKRPTELIKVEKVCSDVSVPRMKLLEFVAGYPPDRRFQLEP